jgi:hypothetical protein
MAIDTDKFTQLCERLVRIGLDGSAPPELPSDVRREITDAAKFLPLTFRSAYVRPLLDGLDGRDLQDPVNLETFGGAVYDHNPKFGVSKELHQFLAVVSDFYRSFLSAKRRAMADFPLLEPTLPPLATFKNAGDFGPFTITAESTQSSIGVPLGVVSLPSVYKDDPILWASLAHETGGHDVIHADLELEPELAEDVRSLFGVSDITSGQSLSQKQLQGLLWSFWIDETAADVYGILNIGPQFAVNLALLLAALGGSVPTIRSFSGPNQDTGLIDEHPTDILRIHVAIGVVQSLRGLSVATRQQYIDDLQALATLCAGGATEVQLQGNLPSSSSRSSPIVQLNESIDLSVMQQGAVSVGALIANTKATALGGHNIQELETWDDLDEQAAQRIATALAAGTAVDDMGDDAQVLAGATIALTAKPKSYDQVNPLIQQALAMSFKRDPIWGTTRPDAAFVRTAVRKPAKAAHHRGKGK